MPLYLQLPSLLVKHIITRKVSRGYCHASSHCKLVFMFLIVHAISVSTDSMDSALSLAVGEAFATTCKAMVSRDPPSELFSSSRLIVITRGLDSTPSGRIENPEGRIASPLESHPVITDCIPWMSTGAYTTIDSYAFVHVSWTTHVVLSFDVIVWRYAPKQIPGSIIQHCAYTDVRYYQRLTWTVTALPRSCPFDRFAID